MIPGQHTSPLTLMVKFPGFFLNDSEPVTFIEEEVCEAIPWNDKALATAGAGMVVATVVSLLVLRHRHKLVCGVSR